MLASWNYLPNAGPNKYIVLFAILDRIAKKNLGFKTCPKRPNIVLARNTR